jgi:hypothetical protein
MTQLTPHPKPIGCDVMVNGVTVAVLTRDEVMRIADQIRRLELARHGC